MAHYNEKSLLLRIANDDEVAFRVIFDYYRPIIFRSAFRLTDDLSISEDILQDTFLKIWLKRKQLPEINNFSGWLYTTYVHLMLNRLKKLARRRVNDKKFQESMQRKMNLTNMGVEQKEIECVVRAAVEHLPEKQRYVYRLIKEEGLTRQQAAELMDVAPETVKSNLSKAVKYIRAYCQRELNSYFLMCSIVFSNFFIK